MRQRRLRNRIALAAVVAAAAASVATSGPSYELRDEANLSIESPASRSLRVILSSAAVQESEWLAVSFEAAGDLGELDRLVVTPAIANLDEADLASGELHRYGFAPSSRCPPQVSCELTFEIVAEGDGAASLALRATAEREGGAFSDTARLEILLDE
jgi:hypothetical protein